MIFSSPAAPNPALVANGTTGYTAADGLGIENQWLTADPTGAVGTQNPGGTIWAANDGTSGGSGLETALVGAIQNARASSEIASAPVAVLYLWNEFDSGFIANDAYNAASADIANNGTATLAAALASGGMQARTNWENAVKYDMQEMNAAFSGATTRYVFVDPIPYASTDLQPGERPGPGGGADIGEQLIKQAEQALSYATLSPGSTTTSAGALDQSVITALNGDLNMNNGAGTLVNGSTDWIKSNGSIYGGLHMSPYDIMAVAYRSAAAIANAFRGLDYNGGGTLDVANSIWSLFPQDSLESNPNPWLIDQTGPAADSPSVSNGNTVFVPLTLFQGAAIESLYATYLNNGTLVPLSPGAATGIGWSIRQMSTVSGQEYLNTYYPVTSTNAVSYLTVSGTPELEIIFDVTQGATAAGAIGAGAVLYYEWGTGRLALSGAGSPSGAPAALNAITDSNNVPLYVDANGLTLSTATNGTTLGPGTYTASRFTGTYISSGSTVTTTVDAPGAVFSLAAVSSWASAELPYVNYSAYYSIGSQQQLTLSTETPNVNISPDGSWSNTPGAVNPSGMDITVATGDNSIVIGPYSGKYQGEKAECDLGTQIDAGCSQRPT